MRDEDETRQHRRSGEIRLQALADSPLLKVLQYMITGIAVPLLVWGTNSQLDRMARMEGTLQQIQTTTATYEVRIRTLEDNRAAREVREGLMIEKTIKNEVRIQELEAQLNRSMR